MTHLRVRIDLPPPIKGLVRHTIDLLPRHFEVQLEFVEGDEMLAIGNLPTSHIQLSPRFIQAILQRQLRHEDLMLDEPLIKFDNGHPDYLGTCAYMVHFLQEQVDDPRLFDDLDRFRYSNSFQHRFDCVQKNLVLQYLIKLTEHTRSLQNLQRKKNPTRLFLSHDIDVLNHSIWPDLKTAFKRGRPGIIWKLLTQQWCKDQDLALFQRILTINRSTGYDSAFFWLVNQKKYRTASGLVIENANYDFQSGNVQRYLDFLEDNNQENQLHQSLGGPGLPEEVKTFRRVAIANRNHYLAGKLPQLWRTCKLAGIQVDCTASFPEVIGFRNSYGLPVRPYDIENDRPFDIVEVPLHIMDVVLMKSDLTPGQALDRVKEFISAHRYDCLLSLLWHNNYFSTVKYREWLEVYQGILKHISDSGVYGTTIEEVFNDFQ